MLEDGGRGPRLVALYAEAVREVARDLGVLVVDHAAAWDAAATESGDDVAPAGWLDDTFHPGARGHHELTLTLLSTLGIADADSPVCSLHVDDAVGARA